MGSKELRSVCSHDQTKILARCSMQNNTVQSILSLPRAFGLPCITPFCKAGSQLYLLDKWFMIAPVIFSTAVAVSRVLVYVSKRSAFAEDGVPKAGWCCSRRH